MRFRNERRSKRIPMLWIEGKGEGGGLCSQELTRRESMW